MKQLVNAVGVVMCGLLLLVGTAVAQEAVGASKAATKLKISKESRAALKQVKQKAAKAKGLKGEERSVILRQAAAEYQGLAPQLQADPAFSAQAWYSAGENWRRVGELAKAQSAYQQSGDLDAYRYLERATLQVAHMQRRQQLLAEALKTYEKAALIKPDSSRAHEARLWVGRCNLLLKQTEQATAAMSKALKQARKPKQVIEAANRLAMLLIQEGELSNAQSVIQQADAAVAQAGVSGKQAASLQKSLRNMSSRRSLQKARDKQAKTHEDAQDLEASLTRQDP